MIDAIFSQFVEATPVTVMVREIMERIFEPSALDELFETHAVKQYTRELLFSNVVSLMSLVVSGIHPSVSAAYKALEKTMGVSRPALYGKLNGMELGISQALVRYSVEHLQPVMTELGIREHKSIPYQEFSPLNEIGETETGQVFEQEIQISYDDASLSLHRVVIQLHQPTRHGDTEVALLTHLPSSVADATTIAKLYLQRWSIEGMFQVITDTFNCELNTLGYPKAALFVFCLAIVAFNILSTVKAALKSIHGVGKIEAGLSDYYLVEEVQGTFRGMAIALPASFWLPFAQMSVAEFALTLKQWAE
jgi:hypothetical protein